MWNDGGGDRGGGSQDVREQSGHGLVVHGRIRGPAQAKGALAERLGVAVSEAFIALRSYARGHNRRIVEVAGAVIAGAPEGDEVVAAHRRCR